MAMVTSFLFSGWHQPIDPRPLGRFFMKRLYLVPAEKGFSEIEGGFAESRSV
jgi:hypothetical protein